MKTQVRFTVARDMGLPQQHCCVAIGIFLWLIMTCDSTIQREPVVAFPLQQWLREGSMILRYSLIRLTDERGTIFSLLQKIQIDFGGPHSHLTNICSSKTTEA